MGLMEYAIEFAESVVEQIAYLTRSECVTVLDAIRQQFRTPMKFPMKFPANWPLISKYIFWTLSCPPPSVGVNAPPLKVGCQFWPAASSASNHEGGIVEM